DFNGGSVLRSKMERLGIKVLLDHCARAVLGNGHVEGLQFNNGSTIEADLVVIAAGITPNIGLGVKAGLAVHRGILVNDYMETSNPDIFAVGECVEHNGVCYGLIAPLLEQGKVAAATITGHSGPGYEGTVPAAKLKIMGVDVFPAGDTGEATPGNDVVRFEDAALGIYKRLTLRENRLTGVILVG